MQYKPIKYMDQWYQRNCRKCGKKFDLEHHHTGSKELIENKILREQWHKLKLFCSDCSEIVLREMLNKAKE